MAEGQEIDVKYLDRSKAFDKELHHLFVSKLQQYGVCQALQPYTGSQATS